MPNETNVVAINDLTEKTTAVGQDDLLVIAEKVDDAYITKSIKANAVGGGGAGEIINLTFDMANGTVTTDKTAGEILALYQAGIPFTGLYSIEIDGTMAYGQMQFGVCGEMEGIYILNASAILFEEITRVNFQANSSDSVMVANLGN